MQEEAEASAQAVKKLEVCALPAARVVYAPATLDIVVGPSFRPASQCYDFQIVGVGDTSPPSKLQPVTSK